MIYSERITHNGMLNFTYISDHGLRLTHFFIGYTEEEATQRFEEYVRDYLKKQCDSGKHENWYETRHGVACQDCGGEWND